MSDLVILIEDDRRLAGWFSDFLRQMVSAVDTRQRREKASFASARGGVSAIVLDLMLRVSTDWEVCRRTRMTSMLPFLMLTARGDEMDRVGVWNSGGRLSPKPFSPRSWWPAFGLFSGGGTRVRNTRTS